MATVNSVHMQRERERESYVRVASKGQGGDWKTLEKASIVPPNKICSPYTAPNVPGGEIDQLHCQQEVEEQREDADCTQAVHVAKETEGKRNEEGRKDKKKSSQGVR